MKEIKLTNFIDEISMGPFGSNIKVDNFKSSGIPVLNGSNLSNHKLVEDSFNFVSREKADSLGKANAKRGDIVITHRGTLGQVSFIPKNSKFERYVISQSQFRVRFNEKINAIYFSYLMKSEYGQGKLLSFKNHVGVPALAQATTNFKNLEMFIHNISDQQKIATILSSLDDKIELNNKINTELEQMAKTLYDYWFVQFDFPNEEGNPYKSSGGKMIYNEVLKREIPEGWEVNKLGALTSFLSRGISPKYIEGKGGIPVLNQKCIRGHRVLYEFQRRHDSEAKRSSSRLVEKYDVLVNSTGVGTLGRVALVRWLNEEDVTVDSHVTIVRAIAEKINTVFFGYSLLTKQAEIESFANGSTGQVELNRSQLSDVNLLVPPENFQNKFCEFYIPIIEKTSINERENHELTQLRDWLLPMLMNGQVKVNSEYKPKEENLSVAAEPIVAYINDTQLNIPVNKKGFAKQVLAGKIVSEFKYDPNFTDIKFQKIQFLAEHIIEADLNLNYYYQAAGPYDNKFMHTIYTDFNKQKWFDYQDKKFVALEKQEKIEGYYQGYFAPAQERLNKLFELLYHTSEAEAEIIATLYAVWNNRIIEGKPVTEIELIEDFYQWSDRKLQYKEEQLFAGLQWLKENEMEPKGFGQLIKKAKGKSNLN
ncbi:hypothetical protein CPT03_04185 [Pedobacter ginsengisoli]|uniref:Type I restriction modification DNA specificity domain-containing protein n=1 Tax=Pedobacter ginsengisoli TaxID=363852 RepID=A0A2D1U272_9SPHI|nr:restriction endonuclease subunit S [Pedobacter ginsengisoli]ATP55720.1 hypothetical protein CPT03_04185 [Pedobacter ginsengisoli]